MFIYAYARTSFFCKIIFYSSAIKIITIIKILKKLIFFSYYFLIICFKKEIWRKIADNFLYIKLYIIMCI